MDSLNVEQGEPEETPTSATDKYVTRLKVKTYERWAILAVSLPLLHYGNRLGEDTLNALARGDLREAAIRGITTVFLGGLGLMAGGTAMLGVENDVITKDEIKRDQAKQNATKP